MKLNYLFKRIPDIKSNCSNFLLLPDAMDPGKCLLLKGRIPKTVSLRDRMSYLTSLHTSEVL